jgi:uncharacterized damage-inducible protein DinB
MRKVDAAVGLLLDGLDEAFDRKSWHGTNLRGSLRGVTAPQAAWRPAPGRHNIWEIAVHAAYWKYVVRRVITGASRGSFPLRGSNWFLREDARAVAWRQDLQLLYDQHRQLREALAALPASRLQSLTPKRTFTYAGLIRGVAAHDLYHAGQIQLLKRLRVTAT